MLVWLRRDPALVVFVSALSAVARELGRPGRPAGVAGGLVRAEERIEQVSMIGLGRRYLVLQASPRRLSCLRPARRLFVELTEPTSSKAATKPSPAAIASSEPSG